MKLFSSLLIGFLLSIGILNAQHLKKDGTPDRRYKENRTSTSYRYSHKSYSSTTTYHTHRSNYNYSVPRDSHGRIKRSSSARREFMKQTGYPHGRPGYVIDHIKPLKEGGCDCPSNMQWQTKAEAKAKDKWE
ncbi:MAG TPA: HNH endonuclease signature motif containing protein [Chitinophagaceae bacterium]